jgi:hypothetical protein
MARDWFDDYGDPENRSAAVDRHLNRIGLTLTGPEKLPSPDAPASPAELERKRQREAETLRRHDEMFGLNGGLVESLRRVARPYYSQADEIDRDD